MSLMFSDAALKATGRAMWVSRIPRMLSRQRGVKLALKSKMKEVDLHASSGLYLGRRLAQEIDYSRLDRVVTKIIIGLYFLEFGQALATGASTECKWVNTPSITADVKPYLMDARMGKHGWPGVLEYKVAHVAEDPDKSIWFLLFFDYALWWGITGLWEHPIDSRNI